MSRVLAYIVDDQRFAGMADMPNDGNAFPDIQRVLGGKELFTCFPGSGGNFG